jgi:uncharacterized protein
VCQEDPAVTHPDLPPSAAWRHRDAREGFECVFPGAVPGGGWRLDGWTTGVEEGVTWVVGYRITVDARWHTTAASVWSRSRAGEARVEIAADGEGAGRWTASRRRRWPAS